MAPKTAISQRNNIPTLVKIFDFLKLWAPLELAETWDNVGLQVGNLQAKIQRVLVSLDITSAVLEEAAAKNSQLVISHHPLFFSGVKNLDESSRTSRLASFAIRNGIHILSFHTNLDSTREGLNDLLAKQIGLRHIKPFLSREGKIASKYGLGRIGEVSPQTLAQWTEKLISILNLPNLRYVGNRHQNLSKIAVVTGSGASFWRKAQEAQADVLVTGDVKYHDALEATEAGFSIVDVGHFGSEIGMVKLVAGKLRTWAKGRKIALEVFETEKQEDPFKFWREK